jgi:hypothetical protein
MSQTRRPAALAVLALAVALSGCTAVLPAAHPPADLPEEPPRVLCESTWEADRVTVTLTAGHTLTAEGAANLSVAGTSEGTTLWASTVAPERARDTFPVGPGDSLTVAVDPSREDLRLTVASSRSAATLCTLYRGGR